MVRIGMHFATDFRGYFGGWSSGPEGLVTSLTVHDGILDFASFDEAWQGELREREGRSVSSGSSKLPVAAMPRDQPPEPIGGANMLRFGKWETAKEKELGSGAQGKVFLARDTAKFEIGQVALAIKNSVKGIIDTTGPGQPLSVSKAHELARQILKYGEADDPRHCGALKLLHQSEKPDEYQKHLGRMKHEVEALGKINHPNVARILDANLDEHWFVMEYFPDGALANHLAHYQGELVQALVALRPLVQAVTKLHGSNLVHRDIKPENIFVSPTRGLVLGDFGLIFFADAERSRLSDTYENVGSRDWMPGWAMGMRVEEIRPTFDVFCLGKLLWSMVSGKPKLRLWYIHEDDFELEKMFPEDPDIRWARIILDKCVVEKESNCLPNAGELLIEIDRVLAALRRRGQVISDDVPRVCRVCGLGRYKKPENRMVLSGLGTINYQETLFKMYACDRCGHTELFCLPDRQSPPNTT
jgi:serine/threonine protein kinase